MTLRQPFELLITISRSLVSLMSILVVQSEHLSMFDLGNATYDTFRVPSIILERLTGCGI